MNNQRLGCFTPIGFTAGLITLLVIAFMGFTQGGALFSPGPLNGQAGNRVGGVQSHAELSTRCAACHTAPWEPASMTTRCLDCHTNVKDEMGNPKTLHGQVIHSAADANCRNCHTEHQGVQAELTRFDISGFQHESTGFSLKSHVKMTNGQPFTCADCHAGSFTKTAGPACADCHARIDSAYMVRHAVAFGQDCLNCHDGVDSYGKAFDHNTTRFKLTGKHALAANSAIDCKDCHLNKTTLAALKETSTACSACHQNDDAHKGSLGADCAACHTPDGWKPASFDHSKAAFPLAGAHANVQCSGCHQNALFKTTPTDCAGCHQKDDAHKGSLGSDCATCHTPNGWKPASFDHAKSAFPLNGAHVKAQCTACHANQVFKGTPTNCFACHQKDDHHNGQFGTDCSACHTTSGWQPATFDHAKSKFPLTGAHVNVACQKCHANQVFKGTPAACNACHQEPAFHARLFPADCAACHNTSAWAPAKFNQSHPFPINHGGASSCRSCHTVSLASYTCYACHDQAETARRHQEEGISDLSNCARCHQGGGGGEGGGGGG